MRPIFLAALLLCAASCSSCVIAIGPGASDGVHSGSFWSGIRGSGVAKTESRTVSEFHGIRIEGVCDVVATVGGEQSVSLTADDNLLEYVTTEVEDGVLVISMRDGTNARFRVAPTARIQVKALDQLSIEGSGDGDVTGIASESFTAGIDGSGDLCLRGKTTRLAFSINGSGDADLSGLQSVDADVSINGSGDVRLHCTGRLTAAISGSGDVSYSGSPKSTHFSKSGSGSIHSVD